MVHLESRATRLFTGTEFRDPLGVGPRKCNSTSVRFYEGNLRLNHISRPGDLVESRQRVQKVPGSRWEGDLLRPGTTGVVWWDPPKTLSGTRIGEQGTQECQTSLRV